MSGTEAMHGDRVSIASNATRGSSPILAVGAALWLAACVPRSGPPVAGDDPTDRTRSVGFAVRCGACQVTYGVGESLRDADVTGAWRRSLGAAPGESLYLRVQPREPEGGQAIGRNRLSASISVDRRVVASDEVPHSSEASRLELVSAVPARLEEAAGVAGGRSDATHGARYR